MDYNAASALLGKRQSRKLENNTYLVRRDDRTIAVRLHATDVVTFTPDWIELDSGGWHTKTTADRMRAYASVNVSSGSSKGKGWRVWPIDDKGSWDWESGGFVYFDGIRVLNDGSGLAEDQPNAPRGIVAPVLTESGGW